MKFKIKKEIFLNNLLYVEGGIPDKSTIVILSNILLKLDNNILMIYSTDIDISIKTKFEVEGLSDGQITVNAKKIIEIIKLLPEDIIIFELLENNQINIKSTNSNIKTIYKLQGIPVDDYPEIKELPLQNNFILNNKILLDMIKKTINSTSSEDARYFLKGIFFEKKDNIFNCVSTDGKRLAFISHKDETLNNDINFNVIVPSKILNILLKILKIEGDTEIEINSNSIFFKIGQVELTSSLLEGQFPEYEKLIPIKNIDVTIEKDLLLESIKRITPLVDKRVCRISCSFENENLILNTHNEYGNVNDEIPIISNKELKLSLNISYLMDVLKVLETDELELQMNNYNSPVVIYEKNNDNYLNIIMPMKLGND